METDFDEAKHTTHYAGRFSRYKLCTQRELAESLHANDWLKPIDEVMDTISIYEFLESQLAVKRGKIFPGYGYGNSQNDWS